MAKFGYEMCTLYRTYVHVKCSYSCTRIEHTSTLSPVNQTLKYDYKHETQGNGKVWGFRDDVEGQKAMKCVHFAEHVKAYAYSHSHIHNSPQSFHQSTTL